MIMPPVHPGKLLRKDFLKPLGISAGALARSIRVSQTRVNGVLHERQPITADLALRLGRCFGTSAAFWMNLQSHYDLEMEKDRLGTALEREIQVLTR